MASYHNTNFNVSGENGELPEVIAAQQGTWNLFSLLGVDPALGRTFREDEDRVGEDHVAMLTWSFFQRRFGGDPSIVGKIGSVELQPVHDRWCSTEVVCVSRYAVAAVGSLCRWQDS